MGKIIWIFGQPFSGKSTIAKELLRTNPSAINIDGDDLRRITRNIDYSPHGRMKNIYKAQSIANFLEDKGFTVIVSMVTPYRVVRNHFKDMVKDKLQYVYLKCSRTERMLNHASDFEKPSGDDEVLILDTSLQTIQETTLDIREYTGLK